MNIYVKRPFARPWFAQVIDVAGAPPRWGLTRLHAMNRAVRAADAVVYRQNARRLRG